MSMACGPSEPILCGCCEGTADETPEPIYNRPGLAAIGYRVGTHTTFLASLLADLSSSAVPALSGLRTRDPSDFSIALLDGWATCLDILTFYQERLANESYLRTAVDTASVFWLAQLVGYKPSPGVAAATYIAFTLNSAPGSPDNVLVPAGSRVQSVPAPGQSPQVFETSSDITAVIEQNAIPPQTTTPWSLGAGATSIWLQGISSGINVGDGILFVSDALYSQVSSGAANPTGACDFHNVVSVSTNSTLGNTLIVWDQPLVWPNADDSTVHVYVFRKKASLFGVQAPDARTLSSHHTNISLITGWPPGGTEDWLFEKGYTVGSLQVNLDSSYPAAKPASGVPSWTVLVSKDYTTLFQVKTSADIGPAMFTLTSKATQLTLASGQVILNNTSTSSPVDSGLQDIVGLTRSASVYIQSVAVSPADQPYIWASPTPYPAQTGLLTPVKGTTLSLYGGQPLSSGQAVAVSGKRLRLQATGTGSFVPSGATGSLPVTSGQVFLIDAFPPAAAVSGSGEVWQVITTAGTPGVLTISPGNILLTAADPKNDPLTGESAVLSEVDIAGSISTLTFSNALGRIYDRSTTSVNANVVPATQGETTNEILGSGDSTNPALQFTLKQSPLTYVSSPLNNGAVSTLQVWVNNLRWHEVGNFLSSGPSDRVFATQADASQNVTVEFGDGVEGGRPPTGQMNVRAVYRTGIGSAGNVGSGQLTQAVDRPQGLSSVTNPDAASGGADPDTISDARAGAPLNVLTLNRVVSLEDYQNYALTFGSFAKAMATWTWTGRVRSVFLTVAGDDGAVFQPDDQVLANLKSSLLLFGNPYVPVQIASYIPVLFEIGANVLIDQVNYDTTEVLAAVWQSLAAAFSFDQRSLGQGVAQSEVISVIQQVAGVIAVELTAFCRQGSPPSAGPLRTVLRAAAPQQGQTGVLSGAQMLLVDPASPGNLAVWS